MINAQLTEDKIMATRIKQNELSVHTVKNTWEPVLQRYSDNTPNDWVNNREVLVGRGPQHLVPEGGVV
jgi:hypothetical protein